MITPITEMSLADLMEAAKPWPTERGFDAELNVASVMRRRFDLANAVSLAQDMASRAEARTDARPHHWKDAQGELTRLRRELWDTEGEIFMLRAELERRVRRVRTGGAT